MKFSIPFLCLVAMFTCGFGPGDTPDNPDLPEEKPKEEAKEDDSRMDGSQGTIDMYLDGTIEAMYWVQVHADPKVGQYWETVADGYGMKLTYRWQVAVIDGEVAVIESQNKIDSEFMISNYVLAYQVNLKAAEGEANVIKAWIGRPGREATEIKVMQRPEAAGDEGDDGGSVDYEMTEEDFKDLELAGRKWSGKLHSVSGEGWESKSWIATDGWFGGVVKTQAGEMVTELKAFGDDAKPLLTYPDKSEEKKD